MTRRPDVLDTRARDEASREAAVVQQAGADPKRSVVLRASAGSGKTKVLVDRLLRLLLDGAPLKSVAAMTFTRKAAVEIRERLIREVRGMALLPSPELHSKLAEMLHRPPETHEVARAGTLPDELLEDPDGLLIGTIHTFAGSLLRRFADEAGLDPDFQLLERDDELWEEALDGLERAVAADRDLRRAWTGAAASPDQVRAELKEWVHDRTSLDRWRERAAPDAASWESAAPALAADLLAAATVGTSLEDDPRGSALLQAADAALRTYAADGLDAVTAVDDGRSTGTAFPKKVGEARTGALAAADALALRGLAALDDLSTSVFTADGLTPRKLGGRVAARPDINAANERAVAPLLEVMTARDLLALLERNGHLLALGTRLLDGYETLKRRERVLDFHDLEVLARRLVGNLDVGPWILYRMDERLDHLLVDEFQDTNRDQWDLVRPFAEEFTSAVAEDGRPRTVFFVGDVKQSIYGFRGARPEIFGETERWLETRTGHGALNLPTNFRSLPEVVRNVGEVFGSGSLAGLLPPGEAEAATQLPFRDDDHGAVILHPVDVSDEGVGAAHDLAADRFLNLVRELGARPGVRWSDILVLARGRTNLEPYERALRDAGLPFTPAGRGALVETREIRDVLALLRWLTYPADDIALAAVLRSPLLRRTETEVQTLLAGRGGDLWSELLGHAEDPAWHDDVGRLDGWRRRLGLDSAHDLLRRIYRECEALERYGLALGDQARFNLLRLLDLALEHDGTAFPSLRGFVRSLDRAAEAKDREEGALPDTAAGRIRMMTIHGSKGLQARFVILLDAEKTFREKVGRAVLGTPGDAGPVVSKLTKRHRETPPESVPTPLALAATAALDEETSQEANLLYVAMTRAEFEFHILAARGRSERPPHARAWLADTLSEPPERAAQTGAPAPGPVVRNRGNTHDTYAPGPAGGHRPRFRTSAASRQEAEDAPSGVPLSSAPSRSEARDRGDRIHLLLQRACEAGAVPTGHGDDHAEAAAVYANPDHDAVFRPAPDVQAFDEAPIAHRISDAPEIRMLGVVDRLLVAPDAVTIVDYKSNRTDAARLPALVEHYRPQMEAYGAALAAVYPDRPIRLQLLFTHIPGGRLETLT